MNYWLLKSEPQKYSIDEMQKDKKTFWDGVRNYTARINLRNMRKGDLAYFYHSNEGKEIVGIVKIIKEAYQDPTTEDNAWVAVDVQFQKKIKNPVTLAEMKATKGLENLSLIKQSRLSVCNVTEKEWEIIQAMSEN